jgi:hypothetical protein
MHALKHAFAIIIAFFVFAPNSAYAMGGAFINAGIGNAGIEAVNHSISQEIVRKSPTPDDEEPKSLAASLSYTPSKSRTRTNLQAFADKTRAVDPAGASQMEQLFASTDIMGEIGSVMAKYGLSKNNCADAFAVYWVNAWQVSHGDDSTPSAEMMQAVAAQAARGLSQSPEFAKANDAQKQEMAEALMVQGVMIASAFEQAAGDRKQLKALSEAVRQGAAASGLDLNSMTLTEEGFVKGGPRKGADASDTVKDDEAKLASAADGDKTLQYGIMAALGLGAAFMIGKGMRKG